MRVQYSLLPDVGLVADVVALRNIASGDEFLQSYIDTDLGKSSFFCESDKMILLH